MSKRQHRIAIAIVRRGERWLVARRRPDAHLAGLWEFPGGHQTRHETAAQAALRELREECAIDAVAERVLAAVTYEYEDRIVRIVPVICRWLAREPQPIGGDECRWVSASELAALDMPPANRDVVRIILE